MEYDKQTYFTENEYDDVKGFTILKTHKGNYHIAEKWLASDKEEADSKFASETVWLDYWIPESDLQERVSEGLCEEKAKLTDEQYDAVCERVGWYTDEEQTSEKAAA